MPSKQEIKLWKQNQQTATHLRHARQQLELPEAVPKRVAELLPQFNEYLDHNELEIALDVLQEVGEEIPCRGGYWRTLERAAILMGLHERAAYFREQFRAASKRLRERSRGGKA